MDLDGFQFLTTVPSREDQLAAMQREMALPLSERLCHAAEAEDRRGDSFRGCSWTGIEHPSAGHYRQAALFRAAAQLAFVDEQRRARRRKPKTAEAEELVRVEP